MDPVTLAKDIVPYLTTLLPYLLKAGEKAAEEAGKNLAGAAWEKTKALWAKLHPKVEANPLALAAVNKAAESPKDERIQSTLNWQLEDILKEDSALLREISKLWEETKATGINVAAMGDRSVAIGG